MYIESMQLSRYSELNSIGARTCYGSDIAYSDCRNKKMEETIKELSLTMIAPPYEVCR